VNGRKVWYNENDMNDPTLCYSTRLSGSKQQCRKIIDCISTGDFSTLRNCIDDFQDHDLYNIAVSEIQKVPPKTIKLVLNKFGIRAWKDPVTGKPEKIWSFEEWENAIKSNTSIDQKLKDKIFMNNRLVYYIKGLLDVVNSSPSLFIPETKTPTATGTTGTPVTAATVPVGPITTGTTRAASSYLGQLGMEKYQVPMTSRGGETLKYASDIWNNYPETMSNNFISNLIESGMVRNAMFGGAPLAPMIGGQPFMLALKSRDMKYQTSNMFTNLFKSLYAELETVGLKINPVDAKKIENALNNLAKLEEKLAAMAKLYQVLITFARRNGIQYIVPKDKLKTVTLSNDFYNSTANIKSKQDAIEFISKHIKDVNDNMMTNESIQQNIGTDLRFGVVPRLMQEGLRVYLQRQQGQQGQQPQAQQPQQPQTRNWADAVSILSD